MNSLILLLTIGCIYFKMRSQIKTHYAGKLWFSRLLRNLKEPREHSGMMQYGSIMFIQDVFLQRYIKQVIFPTNPSDSKAQISAPEN